MNAPGGAAGRPAPLMEGPTIGGKAWRRLVRRLEARTFSFTARNLALTLAMWVLVSVSLPTAALSLIGPYRVISVVFDDLGWSDVAEWVAVIANTAVIALITLAFAVGLTRVMLVTAYRRSHPCLLSRASSEAFGS